jgi:uroporphyrinogen decarboxylase
MSAYKSASTNHKKKIDSLIADAQANGGLAPLDIEQFWLDQEKAKTDYFSSEFCVFGAILTNECVFDELGIKEDYRLIYKSNNNDFLDIAKRYNDMAEKIVGRRLLNEQVRDPKHAWPDIKALHDIFEAKNVWEGGAGGSWWLKQSASNRHELAALLDRVEKRLDNLREFILPENWETEKKRLLDLGGQVPLYRFQRGPCTFATSIYGSENMMFLFYDDPGLFSRFSEILSRAIIGRAKVLDEEAGAETVAKIKQGWFWADDNCCLFTPEMYEAFAMPIHRELFAEYASYLGSERYQHSDSAMGHLLPLLQELDLTGVNFGPTLTVSEIRKHCPNAIIQGQLQPFTYSRNEEHNMVAEFLRDFDQAREKRGLNFTTAGSINNGSRLSGMRLLMAAIQRYGRY